MAFYLALAGLSLALSDSFPDSPKQKSEPPEPGTISRRGLMIRLWSVGVITLMLFSAMTVWWGSWYDLAYALALVVSLSCAYALTKTGALANVVKSPVLRFGITVVGFAIPCFSYAHGAAQAYSLRFDTRSYTYACEADLRNAPEPDLARSPELRFIGKAGDFYFLQRPYSDHVQVLKFEEFKDFRLRKRFVAGKLKRPENPCASDDN
jgi:hypothetical protein